MANLLADTLVSPSRYMRAYLQQRGWRLPPDARVIPNVMPRRDLLARVPSSPDMGSLRSASVWAPAPMLLLVQARCTAVVCQR